MSYVIPTQTLNLLRALLLTIANIRGWFIFHVLQSNTWVVCHYCEKVLTSGIILLNIQIGASTRVPNARRRENSCRNSSV